MYIIVVHVYLHVQCSLHTIFFLCSPFLFVYPSVLCSNVVKKSVNRVWLATKDNKNQQNKNQFCIYYNRFGKHNICVDISPSLYLYPSLSIFLSVSDTSCIIMYMYISSGRCNRGDKCPFTHDPKHVAVCSK